MDEGSAAQEGYKPQRLGDFEYIKKMHETDPYFNAQAYLEASNDFCRELELVMDRCTDFATLKAELLSLIQERGNLDITLKTEFPEL